MADIVLATINAKWIHPSLALRLLKANLGSLADRAEILEFALRQSLAEKTGPIYERAPRILALSVSIWNHLATLELLASLKTSPPSFDPVIILGGPEASTIAADAGLCSYADYIIRGEGETAFRKLCERILRTDIPKRGAAFPHPQRGTDAFFAPPPSAGVLLRKSPATPQSGPRLAAPVFINAPPEDLNSLASGYRLYTEEDLRRKLVYVEASRGCPFGCEFCLSSLDRKVREFPLEPFLAELELLIRRGGRTFKFLDRTFNLDGERAGRIMDFFLDRLKEPENKGLVVHFEILPSRLLPPLRERIACFPEGSLRLEAGIQTLNPRTAALIGRPSKPEAELETLRFLSEKTRALVHADLIAGLPGEDLASFAEGFDRLWAVRPAEIQLGILKCLPGTPLSRHNEAWGMKYAAQPPYEVLETSVLPKDDLDRVKNFARFWEIIVNRGKFNTLLPELLPPGQGAFGRFMEISAALLSRFGKNWGIDRGDLQEALDDFALAYPKRPSR
ncbi:MAG: DUF4080 domain-containing protein [Spirochaetaceae bacterium]|nr:DUF4080 domain-containing protein [Spirochaetaceae bacterium]